MSSATRTRNPATDGKAPKEPKPQDHQVGLRLQYEKEVEDVRKDIGNKLS